MARRNVWHLITVNDANSSIPSVSTNEISRASRPLSRPVNYANESLIGSAEILRPWPARRRDGREVQ